MNFNAEMKHRILSLAEELGVSEVGFTDAAVYTELVTALKKRGEVPMTEPDIKKRVDPFAIMPGAKTVIVCLLPYYSGAPKGNISRYAGGEDYHAVMRRYLRALAAPLAENGYAAMEFCDSAPLNERYLAHRAGLGFYGKNGFLINPVYGTYTFIGWILTDCLMKPDKPSEDSCMNCGKCAAACPGGALSPEGGFEYKKCISYITQKKGELSAEEKSLLKKTGTVWGCDVCQEVCPHNINAQKSRIPAFCSDLITELTIPEDMSNREFRRVYGARAFSWRGKSVPARNIAVVSEKEKKL